MHPLQNETKVIAGGREADAKANLAVCAETDLGFN
jgi:hypothetical protein